MEESENNSNNNQNVVSEGPIMISTTEVKGEFVMSQLRDKIVDAILKGHLANEENTRVLILSGSHGDGDSGDSGLGNIEKLKDADDKNAGDITSKFYEGDCRRAGLMPLKPKLDIQKLPLAEENIPDITKMKKLNPLFFKNSYLSDNDICNITFQVINIAYYHKNESRLVQDIKRFDPKVLALAWCFSINGDVSMALRQEGIFAKMVMEHDLREITRNTNAKLDPAQAKAIEKIVGYDQKNLNKNLFIWGPSGSGKTLILTEALKIKLNKLRSMKKEGKKVLVFVTALMIDQNCTLIEDMKEKYFKNIFLEEFIEFDSFDILRESVAKSAEVEMKFQEFRQNLAYEKQIEEEMGETLFKDPSMECVKNAKIQLLKQKTEFNAKFLEKNTKADINEIILGFSKLFDYSLLLIDEVPSFLIQDWHDLQIMPNVEWMIGISPGGYKNSEGGHFFQILPPENPSVLSIQMRTRYRNSINIREFHNWWVFHFKYSYLSIFDEKDVENPNLLPPGNLPIWIDRWANLSSVDILKFIKSEYATDLSVTVHSLMPHSKVGKSDIGEDELKVIEWCKNNGWKYVNDSNVQGTEDECIVILTRPLYLLYPEYLSRARNLLIIITTIGPGVSDIAKNQEKLTQALEHKEYQCLTSKFFLDKWGLKKCQYLGKTILKRIILTRADIKCDGCGMLPIHGVARYKCYTCEDFDLCGNCKLIENIHPNDHILRLQSMIREMDNEEFQKYVEYWDQQQQVRTVEDTMSPLLEKFKSLEALQDFACQIFSSIKDKNEASKNVEVKGLTELPKIMQKQILSGKSPFEVMDEFLEDQNENSKNGVMPVNDLEEIKSLTELPNIMERQIPNLNEITNGSVTAESKILQKDNTSTLELLRMFKDNIDRLYELKLFDQETPNDAEKTLCESTKENTCPSGHILLYEEQTDLSWSCDARRLKLKCFRSFAKHVPRYRCPKCDFDICMDCFSKRK